MKRMILFMLVLTLSSITTAQSTLTTVEYQKVTREAIANEIPFSEEVIMNAIKDTLQKLGYKGKESKGFTLFRNVRMPALENEPYDLYFAIDRKSKRQKEVSLVTMMLSKGDDNFITEKSNPDVVHKARNFLNGFHHSVRRYDHLQKLMEQEEVVKKIEKTITDLAEEADDMQKKKKKLEKDIEDNSKEQSDQQKELEKQRQVLATLKATNG